MQVEFLNWRDAGWQAAASLIEGHFAKTHGATMTVPAITLAVAMSRTGAVLGAAGVRTPASALTWAWIWARAAVWLVANACKPAPPAPCRSRP